MPLGMEVGLGPGEPAPPPSKWSTAPAKFSAHVSCGQMAGCIRIPLGTKVDLGPDDIVLGGDPALSLKAPPQFLAHVCCSQMAGWIKMPLATEVGLHPGDFVLDGDPAPPKRGTAPNFWPLSIVAKWLDGSRCHSVRR